MIILISAILGLLLVKGGSAQPLISAYTKINLDECLLVDANEIARNFADFEAPNFNCETDKFFMIPS